MNSIASVGRSTKTFRTCSGARCNSASTVGETTRTKRSPLTASKKAMLASTNSSSKQPPKTDVSAFTRNRFILEPAKSHGADTLQLLFYREWDIVAMDWIAKKGRNLMERTHFPPRGASHDHLARYSTMRYVATKGESSRRRVMISGIFSMVKSTSSSVL